jgi:AdoMet-dependent rRNA methyltransferase SPB1
MWSPPDIADPIADTQFKEIAASEFIQTTDPIAILGQYNRLAFDQAKNGDVALAALDKLPETTEEIRLCCADLKVLGKKEFKLLLKWRLKVREIFGFPTKKSAAAALSEEVAVVEDMDEELKIQEELQRIKDKESSKKKKERRKDNEKKQKGIMRMQMNMTAPMDIGMEQEGPKGEDSMFRLKAIDQTDALHRIAKGKMTKVPTAAAKLDRDSGIGSSPDDDETDEEADQLERELDNMYDQFRERKAASDAKYRAKKARKEHGDDEWEGVSGSEKEDSDDDEEEALEEDSDDSDSESEGTGKSLLRDLDNTPEDEAGLSKRARNFFTQDIFQSIPGLLDVPEEESEEEAVAEADAADVVDGEESEDDIPSIEEQKRQRKEQRKEKAASKDKKDGKFEVVKENKNEEEDWEEKEKKAAKDGRPSKLTRPNPAMRRKLTWPDIDIITAEAMTLAHQLARGEKSVYDIMDEGYNKYAFKDRDGLPDWFNDDEGKHDRPHKPISKEAADAIKEKLRAYNARPIKKVAEARARKKFKQAQKLEKLKKKADLLAGDEVCQPAYLDSFHILTSYTGYVGEGQGHQHCQAHLCGRAHKEEGARQGGQGRGRQPWSLWQTQRCQGPVQDGGPAHEEGDAGAEAGCEEEVECGQVLQMFICLSQMVNLGWIEYHLLAHQRPLLCVLFILVVLGD